MRYPCRVEVACPPRRNSGHRATGEVTYLSLELSLKISLKVESQDLRERPILVLRLTCARISHVRMCETREAYLSLRLSLKLPL